jgi:E3 ubiquitin-protein ligase TRIP12
MLKLVQCEMLSIATEESLSTFSVDSFVPLLVTLLNAEHNPEIMLLAARALTHLADVLPSSCVAIVHYGAASCFCERLLTIEYIDLAEQSLQALEKLSQEHPVACLRPGGLMAVLSYLDFFATGVQRVAVTTAANMCRQLPPDVADMVVDCVPILTNLLTYQDSKVSRRYINVTKYVLHMRAHT